MALKSFETRLRKPIRRLRLEELEDRTAPSVATTTSVVTSPTSSTVGQQVTFNATVQPRIIGFGVNGDSLSDEYSETSVDSGVENYSYAKNWIELLAAQRSFPVGQQTGTWGEPRRTKFEFNWARAGGTSATLISQGQHTGLAAQITSGNVNYAVLAIGQNDFIPDENPFDANDVGAYINIYKSQWNQTQIDAHVTAVVNNIKTAIDTLTATGVPLVVSNIADYSIAPIVRAGYTVASQRELVTNVIRNVNTQINSYANTKNLPVVDLMGLTKFYFGENGSEVASRQVGGVTFTNTAGTGGTNAFVADGIHPHTSVSACLANVFLEAFKVGYGADFLGAQKFTEQEIVQLVGQTFTGNTINLNYSSFVIAPSTLPTQIANPTGAVQFQVDGTNFGSPANLTSTTNNRATASIPNSALTAGTRTITANYVATGQYVNSSGNTSHTVSGGLDFGDAPSSYGTTLASNGARHNSTGAMLGASRDSETDGQPHSFAQGDDAAGTDDEDGIFGGNLILGQATTFTINVTGAPGKIDAWVDFNRNGVFDDPSERVTGAGGTSVIAGSNTLSITPPANAPPGLTFARFRLSTAGGLAPTGPAGDGEVEDYPLSIYASTKLTFVSNRPSREVYVMRQDGNGQTQLTTTNSTNDNPAWSPDGSKIVWRTQRDGGSELYVMNADGSGQTRLTNTPAFEGFPVWSPDGTKIAFARDGNLCVMNPDGTGVVTLTTTGLTGSSDDQPSWSPDGRRIAFRSIRDGNFEIYVMNADGSNQTRLTNDSAGASDPEWSPDGKKIAFRSSRTGSFQIFTMDPDGGNQTNITTQGASGPTWSPDGTKIAFVTNRNGNNEIYVMNADGTGQVRITNNSVFDDNPAWGGALSGGSQTITFAPLADKAFGDAAFQVSATASSTLPVSFSVVSGPATINGNTVTITGVGQVTIRASQAGNSVYTAAAEVDRSFTVNKADQTITFGALSNKTFGDPPFNVSATASSGLAVSFSVFSGPASISGNQVTLTGAGVVTIRASQGGDANYNAAATVDQSFTVAAPSLDFGDAPNSYGTTLASNGARHTATGLRLGVNRDTEADGTPTASAFGDDGFPSPDDEDGVSGGNFVAGQTTNFTVNVTGATGRIDAWIDFNRNGAFDDPSERVTPAGGMPVVIGNNTLAIATPANATLGLTYARVRLSTAGGLGPTGVAGDGEVEDYSLFIFKSSKIVYASDRDGNFQIYGMNPDGSGQTRLTNNAAFDMAPIFSPDGSRIAFMSDRNGAFDIYVMNADGTGETRLTNNPAEDTNPAWAPDGDRIVFESRRDGNREIYIMNANGTSQTRVTNSSELDDEPSWSVDDIIEIAYRRQVGANSEIFVMATDGSSQTNITNDPADDSQPEFSPDGRRIVFTSIRDEVFNIDIFVMNANGTGQTRLTTNPALDSSATWSPDGGRIAFRSLRDGNYEIYAMNADGTSQTRITNNNANDADPSWGGSLTGAYQVITLAPLPNKNVNDAPFNISATASSGLAVSLAVVSGPATINGNQVTLTGPGLVTIRASQSGNATFMAAPSVDRSFLVLGSLGGTLAESLVQDNNANGQVDVGDVIRYTATITNNTANAATDVSYSAQLDPNSTLLSPPTVVAKAPIVFSDDFNRAANDNIGSPWTERFGNLAVGADNRLTGGGVANTATLSNVAQTDVELVMDYSLAVSGFSHAGLVARYQGTGEQNMYAAIVYGSPGSYVGSIWRNVAGTWTQLVAQATTTVMGEMHFEVAGSSLRLLIDDVLVASTFDSTFRTGESGVRLGSGAFVDNFEVRQVAGFRDPFSRANSTNIGASWTEQVGDLAINNDRLLGTAGLNVGTGNSTWESDIRLEADFDLTPAGVDFNHAGLVARHQGPGDQNMYLGVVYTSNSVPTAAIFRNAGGNWVQLAARNIGAPTGLLRFEVIGTALRLFVNNALAVATVDSTFRQGRTGVRMGSGMALDNLDVTRVSPSIFDDDFNRADQIGLGDAYAETPVQAGVGDYSIVGNQLKGVGGFVNLATVTSTALTDVSVEADVNLVGSGVEHAGLIARYQGMPSGDYYAGAVFKNGSNVSALIYKSVSGGVTVLDAQTIGSGAGTLRFDVVGNTLGLFLNGTVVGSAFDGSITGPGLAGVRSSNQTYDNLSIGPATSKFAAVDTFNRVGSIFLGSRFKELLGDYSVVGNRTVATGGFVNVAVLNDAWYQDVAVQADVNLAGSGFIHQGVVARYQGVGDQDMYAGLLFNTGSGPVAGIFRNVGGTWTVLATAPAPSNMGTLRLEAVGPALRLFFNGVLTVTAADSVIKGPGLAGIRGSSGQGVDNLSVEPLTGDIYLDVFNRSDRTGLGIDYTEVLGDMAIVSNQLQPTTGAVNLTIMNNVQEADVEVFSFVTLAGNGSQADLVARYSGPGDSNMYIGRLTQVSGEFFAQIVRNVGGVVTQLASAPVNAGMGYVRFEVRGNALTLCFNGNPVVQASDTMLQLPGLTGMRGTQGVNFDLFQSTPFAMPNQSTGNVSRNLGTLAPGQSVQTSYLAVVNNPLPAYVTQVGHNGTVTGTDSGTLQAYSPVNTNTVSRLAIAAPDLRVFITGPTTVPIGDVITYTLTYTNLGTQDDTDVSLNVSFSLALQLQAGSTFGNGAMAPWVVGPSNSFSLSVGNVPVRATFMVTLVVKASQAGTLTANFNISDIGGQGADLDPSNNSGVFDMTIT